MKNTHQLVFYFVVTYLQLVISVSELCFLHNDTSEGVYIQCGDLIAGSKFEQYAEHLEVQSIQMGWNTSIPVFDYGLFTQFTELKTLLLIDVNIETIGARAFYGMERLQELSFYDNKISKISSDMFTQLYVLRVLNLGQNRIETLQDNTFSSLYQLETLILKWNNIKNVSKGTFNGLRGLLVLNLRGNMISELKSDVFEDMYFLKSLDLSFNALTNISPTLFANQRDLLNLTIESNNVKTLPGELFQNTTDLQYLDVSNNLLTHFQEDILNNTAVEILKFGRNHITTLNVTHLLRNMNYLNEVELDHNPWNCKSLQNIADEFQTSQVYFKPPKKATKKHSVEGIACEQ